MGGGGQAQVIELNRNLCKLCSRSIEKSRGFRYSRERTERGWRGGGGGGQALVIELNRNLCNLCSRSFSDRAHLAACSHGRTLDQTAI